MATIDCMLSYDPETSKVALQLDCNDNTFDDTHKAIEAWIAEFQFRIDGRERCPAVKGSSYEKR